MRYLNLLLFCAVLLVVSCSGNDRTYKTNQEVFESGHHSEEFLEIVEYIPESYTEVVIDSTFSNGYKVNATFFSDMKNAVLLSEKNDSLTRKIYFREFSADIKIYKNQNILFDNTINKDYLIKEGVFTEEESQLYAINDFSFLNYIEACEGCPTLSLHYTNTKSNEIKIIRFYFHEDKSFFEIIT